LFFPSSCELFLSPPTQKKNSSGTSLAFSLSLLSQAGFCFCLVKKNIHTISRHIKNKKNARDEKAERAVNSRRAFLPCSSSLSRPRLGARASFCDAIIKNREREREREEYFVRTKQKGKKNVFFRGRPARPDLFVDMDQRKLFPQNKGEEENFQISVCVRSVSSLFIIAHPKD
jgi:hypothetical protein